MSDITKLKSDGLLIFNDRSDCHVATATCEEDAAELAGRWNAYPELVAELKDIIKAELRINGMNYGDPIQKCPIYTRPALQLLAAVEGGEVC